MSVLPAEKTERTKLERNLMVPETGIEPVRPLASKRRLCRHRIYSIKSNGYSRFILSKTKN